MKNLRLFVLFASLFTACNDTGGFMEHCNRDATCDFELACRPVSFENGQYYRCTFADGGQ